MKRPSNQKRRAGFTLAEILVAVAILTILLALAVPNVLAYYRRLKLAELDDSARAIFMAAQNRMTAMINAGEMEKLTPNGTTGIGSLTVSFLEKGSTGELLPAGSIESDLAQGNYIIEYFPESGAVYAVFFTDDKDGIKDYPGSYKTLQSRGRTDRLEKKPLVGYYGDSEERQIDRVEVGQLPVPQVTLTNAEELMLDIVLPPITSSSPDFKAEKLKLEVTLSNATSAKKTIVEGKPGNGTTIHLALDTLEPSNNAEALLSSLVDPNAALTNEYKFGAHFKDWVGSSGIQPGDDIKVTVTVSYANGGSSVQFLPQTVVVTGNSLFASVDGTTAKVAYGRHLQNLDPAVSGVKGDITQAEQVREIDFEKTGGGIESWAATYGDLVFDPIENAKLTSYDGRSLPIRKLNAQNSSGSAGLFGDITNSCTLKNIVLIDGKANGTTVGTLAGTAQGVTVENCQVYLATEGKATGATNDAPADMLSGTTVGGLIGSATDCTIENSFASTVENGNTVGGLLGTVSGGTVKNCYAAGYLSGGTVGGLLGGASGTVTVSDCYAAGIIAKVDSTATVLAAAGLCPDAISITNGYAAVRYGKSLEGKTVIGTTKASGNQIPYVRQPEMNYQGYGKPVTTSELKKNGTSGTWLHEKTEENPNPLFAVFPYWQTKETTTLQPPYPYPMLKGSSGGSMPMIHYGDWLEAESGGFLAYYEKYKDNNVYGLHTNYAVGDDAASTAINTLTDGVVEDDGYAILCEGDAQPSIKIGATEYSASAADPNKLIKLTNGTVEIDGKTYQLYALPDAALEVPASVESYYTKVVVGGNESEPYYFNPHFACEAFDSEPFATSTPEQLAEKLAVPQPKTVTLPAAFPTGTTSANDVIIRTARQLADLAAYTKYVDPSVAGGTANAVYEKALAWNYHQLLDIDYTTYTGHSFQTGKEKAYAQLPAQLVGGSYDGYGHTISNLYLTAGADNNAGLFGTVRAAADPVTGAAISGTLQNIHMLQIDVSNTLSASVPGNFGCLAGVVDGGTLQDITLETVAVSDANGVENTGGMVGEVTNGSTLTNIVIKESTVTSTYATDTGGMAGKITGGKTSTVRLTNTEVIGANGNTGGMAGAVSNVEMEDCGIYVEANEPADRAAKYGDCTITSTGANTNTGGLIGSADESANISSSFASVKVSGPSGSIGGFAGKLDKVTVKDCYSGGHTVGKKYDGSDGNVSGTGKVGGFAGSISSTTFSGVCYSTCSVKSDDQSKSSRGRFAGEGNVNTGATIYALGDSFDSDGNKQDPRTENNVQTTMSVQKPGKASYPYDSMLNGKEYPYPSNQTTHYGDWPQGGATAGCFYWEIEDGQYHFYLLELEIEDDDWHAIGFSGKNSATRIENLCHNYDTNPITDYGYGFFTAATDGSKLSVNGNYKPEEEYPELKTALAQYLQTSETGQDFTTVDKLTGQVTTVDYFNVKKVVTSGLGLEGVTFNYDNHRVEVGFNLAFGAALATANGAVDVDGNKVSEVPTQRDQYGRITYENGVRTSAYPCQVRNIDQLTHVQNYLDSAFVQGHDLNGYQSDSGTMQTISPAVNGTDFKGIYNGNCYRILDLNIASDEKNAALFAGVTDTGIVKNVIMYSTHGATIKELTNGKACVAGIAGDLYNGGIIENCIVAGYTMQAEYKTNSHQIRDWCIGGIVGWLGSNSGINNCEAVVTLKNTRNDVGLLVTSVDGETKTTGVCMGGIVGHVSNGGKDWIKNCYAGGTIWDDSSNRTALIRAGGIVGLRMGSHNLDLTNCYSYMGWIGEKGTNTSVFPIIDPENPYKEGTTVELENKNLFYLKDDSSDNSMGTQDDVDPIDNIEALNERFKQVDSEGQLIFHPASFINGEQVPDPAPADKDFNGAVVSVPINGAGDVQYVHYGELPKDP